MASAAARNRNDRRQTVLKQFTVFKWIHTVNTLDINVRFRFVDAQQSLCIFFRELAVFQYLFHSLVLYLLRNGSTQQLSFAAQNKDIRSEEHTSELQSRENLVCR